MYYADPADEGEPLTGLFRMFPVLAIISIFSFSCKEFRQKIPELSSISLTDTIVQPIAKKDTIAVKPKKKKKKIYLTFDDGPNKGTRNVLNIVKDEQVPVTFFIVGEHVFASAGQAQMWDSLKSAANVELCNHSYSHAHGRYDHYYSEPDSVVKDMKRAQVSVLPGNNIVRTPGRNSWRIDSLHFTDISKSRKAIDSLQAAGFKVVGWDLEWHYDPKTMAVKSTADEMLTQIDSIFAKGKTKTRDNLVILAHDQVYTKSTDSLQLRDFIQKLKKKEEYELALVSSYPGVSN